MFLKSLKKGNWELLSKEKKKSIKPRLQKKFEVFYVV